MGNHKKLFTALIILALLQILVPAKMIYDHEKIYQKGKDFKFQIAPIDPNNPFLGKYLVLNFRETRFKLENPKDWYNIREFYVTYITDKNGYAKIENISGSEPEDNSDYIIINTFYFSDNEIVFNYPFNKFFVDEYKAPQIEEAYNKAVSDSTLKNYALVSILDGRAVLIDVIVNNISVKNIKIKK